MQNEAIEVGKFFETHIRLTTKTDSFLAQQAMEQFTIEKVSLKRRNYMVAS
jgi:hypothetical protein